MYVFADVTYPRIIMNKMMIDIVRNTNDMAHPMYETIESASSALLGYKQRHACEHKDSYNSKYILTGLSSCGLTRTAKLVKCVL